MGRQHLRSVPELVHVRGVRLRRKLWRRGTVHNAYPRLLTFGLTTGPSHPDIRVSEPERSVWLREVAEPWWEEMEARAERDGVRVARYLQTDTLLGSMGYDPLLAAVELVGPRGQRYKGSIKDYETRGELMWHAENDWGETLAAAQRAAGIKVRPVRRPRGAGR